MSENKLISQLYEIKEKINNLIEYFEEDIDTVYDTDSDSGSGTDIETVDDCNDLNNIHVNISPNLYNIINNENENETQTTFSNDLNWTPPSQPGLNNSKPLL